MPYTQEFSKQIDAFKTMLDRADCVMIGAGAGLSTAAGFTYAGERFRKYFSDFAAAYGFTDMYAGGFYPYATPEEYWAYWSRYVYINRYDASAGQPYDDLLAAVKDKNYFVLTTNVDHRFQVAGFDKNRLFYTQGDYGLFQCSVPCHDSTYDNEATIRAMVKAQVDRKVPAELIPKCPVCGAPMTMNLRADDKFVEDDGWRAASERYRNFVRENADKDILYLELGVGYNTPVIIKFPFWQQTAQNPRAKYVCINLDASYVPPQIADRSVSIAADIASVLSAVING